MHLPTVRVFLIPAFFIVTLASAQAEASVTVHVAPAASDRPLIHAVVTAHFVGGTAEQHPPPDATAATSALGTALLNLPRGVWAISASAKGFVATEKVLSVDTDNIEVNVALWPAATLAGTIRDSKDARQIDQLTVTYAPSDQNKEPLVPSKTVDCSLVRLSFTCVVPAGTIDYNLHARGFASVFRWGDALTGGATKSLGEVSFVRGASLIGRAIVKSRATASTTIAVRIAPVGFVATGSSASRGKLARRETRVNAKGFFQFDGLPPGKYEVTAAAPNLVSQKVEVTIVDGREAELREPIMLDMAKKLRVHISPPLDPRGNPWSVELAVTNERANFRRIIATESADLTGYWSSASLAPDTYSLRIRREPQASWYSDEFALSDDAEKWITIREVKVTGKVRIGDKPVHGFVWFGGDRAAVSIPTRTDDDGIYRVTLPSQEGEFWREVDVVADAPPIKRALYDVRLEPSTGGESDYHFDIDLPAQGIFGEVYKSDGKAAANASVYAANDSLENAIEGRTGPDGGFGFDGLEPGTYAVRAISGDSRSETARVTVSASNRAEVVRLTLREGREIAGRMTWNDRPIAGGRVWIIQPDRSAVVVTPTPTELDGTFKVAMPPNVAHVCVVAAAPGFGLRFFDQNLPIEFLNLPMSPTAAGLVLGNSNSEEQRAQQRLPILSHNGTFLPVLLVSSFSGVLRTERAGAVERTTIEGVEPGEYSLCYARQVNVNGETQMEAAKCARGMAVGGGTLNLSIDEPAN
jgi:uncharacterized protein (DUF2141 family)